MRIVSTHGEDQAARECAFVSWRGRRLRSLFGSVWLWASAAQSCAKSIHNWREAGKATIPALKLQYSTWAQNAEKFFLFMTHLTNASTSDFDGIWLRKQTQNYADIARTRERQG